MMDSPVPTGGRETRSAKLSKDGKWRSFPKVPHLLQYLSSGQYFGRTKVNGKVICRSLETAPNLSHELKGCTGG